MTTKGYPSSTSVYPGEELDFYLSSDPPITEPVTLEIEYVCGTSFESFSYYLKLEEGIPFQPDHPRNPPLGQQDLTGRKSALLSFLPMVKAAFTK